MRIEDEDGVKERVTVEPLDDGWTVCFDGAGSGYWRRYVDAIAEAEALRRDIAEVEKRIVRRRRRWSRRTHLVDSYARVLRAESRTDRDYLYWLMRRRGLPSPNAVE